jgi:hypothetical protein
MHQLSKRAPALAVAMMTLASVTRAQHNRDKGEPPATAKTVAACGAYLNGAYDRAQAKGGKVDYNAVKEESIKDAKACAAKFTVDKTPREDLPQLASIYVAAGLDDQAAAAMQRYVETAKTTAEKIEALYTAAIPPSGMGAVYREITPERLASTAKYLVQLDAMGDAAVNERRLVYVRIANQNNGKPAAKEYLNKASEIAKRAIELAKGDSAKAQALSDAIQISAQLIEEANSPEVEATLAGQLKAIEAITSPAGVRPKYNTYAIIGNNLRADEKQPEYLVRATELAKQLPTDTVAAKGDYPLSQVYQSLAEAYGRRAQIDKMNETFAQAEKALPDGAKAVAGMRTQLDIYTLVGRPAAAIDVTHWLNTPPDQPKKFEPKGNVSLVYFTAHY